MTNKIVETKNYGEALELLEHLMQRSAFKQTRKNIGIQNLRYHLKKWAKARYDDAAERNLATFRLPWLNGDEDIGSLDDWSESPQGHEFWARLSNNDWGRIMGRHTSEYFVVIPFNKTQFEQAYFAKNGDYEDYA